MPRNVALSNANGNSTTRMDGGKKKESFLLK